MPPPTPLKRLSGFLNRRPAPRSLVALYLSVRFRCLVSPAAKIDYPLSVRIGRGSRIGACHFIARSGQIEIGADCEVQDGVVIDTQEGQVRIGDQCRIGSYTILYGLGGIVVGAQSSIAAHSMIVASSHSFKGRKIPIRDQASTAKGISIGRDVWIGANCVVIDGATIGQGCVIGAASVVRGNVEAFAVAVGCPARVIRVREDA